MYLLGILVAIPIAWIMKRYFFPSQPSPFFIELPRYTWPSWRVVLHRVWEQVYSFVARAGTLILCTTVLLWAAAYFPESHHHEIELTQKIETIKSQIESNQATSIDNESIAKSNSELELLRDQVNVERGV